MYAVTFLSNIPPALRPIKTPVLFCRPASLRQQKRRVGSSMRKPGNSGALIACSRLPATKRCLTSPTLLCLVRDSFAILNWTSDVFEPTWRCAACCTSPGRNRWRGKPTESPYYRCCDWINMLSANKCRLAGTILLSYLFPRDSTAWKLLAVSSEPATIFDSRPAELFAL